MAQVSQMTLRAGASRTSESKRPPQEPPPRPGGIFCTGVYERYCQALGLRMQAYRQQRAVALGPHLQLVFENPLTVAHRTLQALHSSDFDSDGSLDDALLRFAYLLPDGRSLCATLEPNPAAGADTSVVGAPPCYELCIEWQRGAPVRASFVAPDTPDTLRERPFAAQGLRFDLPSYAQTALRELAPARFSCRHNRNHWHQLLPQALLAQLRGDLNGLAPPLGLAAALTPMWAMDAGQ